MMPEQNPPTQAPSNNVGTIQNVEPAWLTAKPEPKTLPAPIPLTNRRKAEYVGFPEWAFPIVLKDAIEAIAENVKLPIEMAGASVLAAASYVAQSHVDVMNPKGIQSPTSVFMLTVGKSGERKSVSDSAAMKPIKTFQEQLKLSYESQMKSYNNAHDVWKRERDIALASKNVSREERTARIVSLGPEPMKPLHYKILISNPTVEGVTTQLSIGEPSLGIFSDEAAIFIGGFSMNKDNKLHTIGMLSKLWDEGAADRTRKSAEDSYILAGRRAACHLLIQPGIAEDFLADKAMREQGIMARYLISWPESNIGNRFIEEYELNEKLQDDLRIQQYNNTMLYSLQTAWAKKPDNPQELVPTVLELTPEAKNVWLLAHNWIELQMLPGGQYESVTGFASKMLENALRIAGAFEYVMDVNAKRVQALTLQMALHLMQYYAYQQLEVFGKNDYDERTSNAIKLLEWIHNGWENSEIDVITYRDIKRLAPRQVRDSNVVLREALETLEKHNWLIKVPDVIKKRKNGTDTWLIQR